MIASLVVAMMMQAAAPVPFRSVERSTQSFTESRKEVIARSAAEWSAVWKQHAPTRPLPDVDFSREMVVGIFVGTRNSAGYSVEVVGVDRQDGGLVVRYRETAPKPTAITAQIITSPSHLVAVPKTDGPVRFEKVD